MWFLDVSPTALSNLQLAYNSKSGTLDTRDNSGAQGGPAGIICNLLAAAGQSPTECRGVLGGVIPGGAARSSVQDDMTVGGILEARS